jgi:hypothetical protein
VKRELMQIKNLQIYALIEIEPVLQEYVHSSELCNSLFCYLCKMCILDKKNISSDGLHLVAVVMANTFILC